MVTTDHGVVVVFQQPTLARRFRVDRTDTDTVLVVEASLVEAVDGKWVFKTAHGLVEVTRDADQRRARHRGSSMRHPGLLRPFSPGR